MNNANPLPPELTLQFSRVADRVRAIRRLRGAAALLLALIAAFIAGYLVELLWGWSVAGLRGLNTGLAAFALAGFGAIVIASTRSIARQPLAALVESHHRELGERLATTVALADSASPPHGSAALVRALQAETTEHAAALDFRAAVSARATRRLAWSTLLLLLVALTPLFASDAYARFARRLLLAWSPSIHGYALDVTAAEPFIARGRPAVVRVQLTVREPGVRLPKVCTVVFREGDAPPRRQRMEQSETNAFTYTFASVQERLAYHVEAGELASATHEIEPIDPVTIAPGGLTAQVSPPAYVHRDVMPVANHSGQSPFTALQYSGLGFQFKFDRPAQKATIRWRDGDRERLLPLGLDHSGQSAACRILAADAGTVAPTLDVEVEHGITSTFRLPAWTTWTDEAPWFSAVPDIFASHGLPRAVAAGDAIAIRAVAEDQVGLGRVEIEYCINNGPPLYAVLADGAGRQRVEVDAQWSLRGLVKLGDEIKCRLRVADNRRLLRDELPLGDQGHLKQDLLPNVAYLPHKDGVEDRWWTFKVEPQAEPLAKQLANQQRDEFGAWLERIKTRLEQARTQLQKVKSGSHGMPVLSAFQAESLAAVHQHSLVGQQELRALAQKASLVAGLQSLSRLSSEVAQRELGDADQALTAARAKNQPADARERDMGKADQALTAALKRLGELQKLNDVLAQQRLDVHALEQLAAKEAELAKAAEELAAQPKIDEQALQKLREEQAQIAQQLEQLAEKNPDLKPALQQMRQAQASKLAQDAHQLAMNQSKLAKAEMTQWQATAKTAFAELARQQRELAGKVEKLDTQLKPFASLAPQQEAQAAAEQLRDGKIEPALGRQQHVDEALQKLAAQLEQAAAQKQNLRSVVEQLAKTQKDLHQQLHKLGEEFAQLPDQQVRQRLMQITKGQKALHDALGKLDVPAGAVPTRKAIQELTGTAAEKLEKKDTLSAYESMEKARDALAAWARSLPESTPASPKDKENPEARAARNLADAARQLAKEQRELRKATQKLLAERTQTAGASAEHKTQEQNVEKLAQQAMELSQKATPEAKQAAQEAADAANAAQKAMAQSEAGRKSGQMERAAQSESEAALQLSMAGKKLEETAKAMQAASGKGDPSAEAMQKAFQDSQAKLGQAQQQLNQQPKNAGQSMQQAAQSLARMAGQARNQSQSSAQGKPQGGTSPAQSAQPGAARTTQTLPEQFQAHAGKNWGELPGELRTRIVEDLRARYGDEYGPIIQRYFQQIADVPGKK